MSVAFTKENDAEAVAADLPDRPIPTHANLVTAAGLARIEAALAAAKADYAAAQASDAISSDRTAMARATRDLRYWSARRATAQLVDRRPTDGTIGFGAEVGIERADGRRQTYAIVGDDEADPAQGSVSHVSPFARAVGGRQVGDVVMLAGQEVEIVSMRWPETLKDGSQSGDQGSGGRDVPGRR
ncbi:transcription elongation factor [Sandarakinorhabdus cyanobacteriorum]|uniref:Transcription elongation factor n=1 Tax=Sandarakinorhabdus cyanobacteriorum TaxID=1981098 RepID=A0A255Y6W5_9SPHN|nr:transcription elongation factor GreA [Sandarakinorhabdus cyanobacteriorum]OYQ24959.1 transcription elongation factor [Sandarakinorhabdus cyanobacteriorum]